MKEELINTLGGFLIILVAAALISAGIFMIVREKQATSAFPDPPAAYQSNRRPVGLDNGRPRPAPPPGAPNSDDGFPNSRDFSHFTWQDLLKEFAGVIGIILIYSLAQAAFTRLNQRRSARISAD